MLLAQLDLRGEPPQPKIHEGPLSFDGKVQYGGRTPPQEMVELERCEDEEYHKVLQERGLSYKEVGEEYPRPMSLEERSRLLRDLRTGNKVLNRYNAEEERWEGIESCPTKGIIGDSDFTVGSMPGNDSELYNMIVQIALTDNVDFSIVFEGEWLRLWLKVWKRNIRRAVADGKRVLVLTKGDGSIGFNQTIEVSFLKREKIDTVTMKALSFVQQCRPILWSEDDQRKVILKNSDDRVVFPLLAQASFDGSTAMHLVWDTEVMKLMIQKRADVNVRDYRKSSPLHYHSRSVAKELVDILLQSGADVNAANVDGLTPLHGCFNQATLEEGIEDVAKALLQARAEVDATSKENKETALRFLMPWGRADGVHRERCVRLLLDARADADHATESEVSTPLLVAMFNAWKYNLFVDQERTEAIIHILVERRADVNKSCDGYKPLSYVTDDANTDESRQIRERLAEYLRAAGAKPL